MIIFNIPPSITYAFEDETFKEQVPSETDEISDSNYGFEYGASLRLNSGWEDGKNYQMRFTLDLLNPALENLLEYSPKKLYWGGFATPLMTQIFTVKRINADGTTVTGLTSLMYVYTYERVDDVYYLTRYTATKELSYYNEAINVSVAEGSNVKLTESLNNYIEGKINELFNEKGYTLKSKEFLTETGATKWGVNVTCNSPFVQYFIDYQYDFQKMTYSGFFKTTYETIDKGKFHSSVRSVADILTKMNEAGALEDELGNNEARIALAQSIISDNTIKEITVTYLQEIDGTPFAKKITAKVTVPVISQGVYIDDVGSALNIDDFNIFNSACYEFQYNSSTQTYDAYYLKTTWLRSMTTDGAYVDYFLDINQSYRATFFHFIEDGVFTQALYEYVFNKMLNEYPQLNGMKYDEVYGYFGFISIPTTMTFDTLFVEMFDVKTSSVGVLKQFSFEDVLSADAYNKLLTKYNYGWLAKAWGNTFANITGNTKATYYMFYSEGELQSVIGEGGQTDPEDTDGAIWNTAQGIAGAVWGFISGNGGLNALLILAVIGLGVYIFFKAKYSIIMPAGRTGAPKQAKPRKRTTKKRKK